MADTATAHSQSTVTSFLRYPGSKRRMLDFLGDFLPPAETIQGRYVEPFVGSGAVFLFVSPRRALLSDINQELIDLYRGIRLDPALVWKHYCGFGRTKADYRRVRASETPRLLVKRAARVLYLNRTCFKGMWRHNRDGQFNVGYGGQSRRWAIDEGALSEIARALRRAKIRCSDFEPIIDQCDPDDFLFLDPPYCPSERQQVNDHYISHRFSFDDQRRLASALHQAKRRGVKWMMTNSSHPDVVSLFRGSIVTPLPRGTGRRPGSLVRDSGEVLISSFRVEGAKDL